MNDNRKIILDHWQIDGTQGDTDRARLVAWHKGINPYPRLTMDESWTLIHLMGYGCNTDEEHETSGRLQRKACGVSK